MNLDPLFDEPSLSLCCYYCYGAIAIIVVATWHHPSHCTQLVIVVATGVTPCIACSLLHCRLIVALFQISFVLPVTSTVAAGVTNALATAPSLPPLLSCRCLFALFLWQCQCIAVVLASALLCRKAYC